MIVIFEKENEAAREHELRLFEMFNNEQSQNNPFTSQQVNQGISQIVISQVNAVQLSHRADQSMLA